MIKIKNNLLNNTTIGAINVFLQKDVDIELSYEVALLVEKMNDLKKTYEKTLMDLREKYCKKDKDGVFELKDVDKNGNGTLCFENEENEKKYLDEINKLGEYENNLEKYNKISITKLKENGIKLPPSITSNLLWLFQK